jgi:hypothetical protein
MKTIVIPVVLIAAAAASGCTYKHTTVEPASPVVYSPPPVVYTQPAPTAVYQAPTTTVAYDGRQTVTVKYAGASGFDLAVRKANDWCDEHYGADARLIRDEPAAGRAIFDCAG